MVYRAIMRLGISIHTPVDATRPQSLAAGNIASVAAAAAAGLFFMALLIRSLVANVFRRVRLSVDAMAQVASGRFTARVTDDRQDEITPLIAQFNRLLSYLENTVAELIAKERQKRDAQLVALQYQINPHFIYNSLYIVQLAVEKQGLFDVANAISWFASILHYNVAGSMFATFQQEIEHIHTYLKFINTFREQAITLQVSLPDELRRKLFLRFIFQPIIENAIKYGGRQVSLIAIAVDHRGDQFLVDVWNDGEPIDDEALAHVNLSLRAPEGEPSNDKGVGLRNIARRLHLFYQSQAGVYMTNGARTGVHIYFCDREVAAHEHTLADRG